MHIKYLILLFLIISVELPAQNSLPEINLKLTEVGDLDLKGYYSGDWGDTRTFVIRGQEPADSPVNLSINRIRDKSYANIKKNILSNMKRNPKNKFDEIYAEGKLNSIVKVTNGSHLTSYISIREESGIILLIILTGHDSYQKMNQEKWIMLWKAMKLSQTNPPIYEIKTYSLEEIFQLYKTNYVLLVQSTAIDYYPLWSQNGQELIYNIKGEWRKTELENFRADEGRLRGSAVAIITNLSSKPVDKKYVDELYKKQKYGARKVTTSQGIVFELKAQGMSTQFIRRHGEKSTVLWTSDLASSHSLSLSPDEKYIAYVSEQNGIMLFRVNGD